MVNKLMTKLGCTEAEALDIIANDKAIDRGADPFPLSAEQKQAEKKMRATGSKAKTESKPKTHRKDEEKAQIIAKIANFLQEDVENLEIINKERQIFFKMGENSYELILTKQRK